MISNAAISQNAIDTLNQEKIIYQFLTARSFSETGLVRANGRVSGTATSYVHTKMVDMQGVKKLLLHNKLASETATTLYPVVVWYAEDSLTVVGSYEALRGEKDYEISVPSSARYAIINSLKTFALQTTRLVCHADYKCQNNAPDIVYVSSQCGNDGNDGLTAAAPVLSINQANRILSPRGTLVMLDGDYYSPEIDLANYEGLIGQGNVRIINGFKIDNANLVDTVKTLYSIKLPFSVPSTSFLWLHEVPDTITRIKENERHFLHGGRKYRMPSTRIYHSDENYENWQNSDSILHWTVSNGTLYFTVPRETDLSATPVVVPRYDVYSSSENHITINNIKILYSCLLLNNLTGSLENVSVGMCNATGAFNFAGCKTMDVISCEAFGSSNDGFNTHASVENNSEISFENCYGHDNSDDGESCHEYSKSHHLGGLFEYNGNGITPASGGQTSCKETITRNNGPWYLWTGTNREGTGFSAQGISSTETETAIFCRNCISINNIVGFNAIRGGISYAINCSATNNSKFNFLNIQNFQVGDVDGNGVVNVSDITTLVNYILGNTSNSFINDIADIDKNNRLDVNDVVGLLNIILQERP